MNIVLTIDHDRERERKGIQEFARQEPLASDNREGLKTERADLMYVFGDDSGRDSIAATPSEPARVKQQERAARAANLFKFNGLAARPSQPEAGSQIPTVHHHAFSSF
jgi:hypothetical protein